VTLDFTDDGIAEIAKISAEVNASIENIGARRLHTVMERLLDDISFKATDKSGETVVVDKAYVKEHVGKLAAYEEPYQLNLVILASNGMSSGGLEFYTNTTRLEEIG